MTELKKLIEAARGLLSDTDRAKRAGADLPYQESFNALRAAIPAAEAELAGMEWVPVSERVPKPGKTYLVYGTFSQDVESAWYSFRRVWFDRASDNEIDGVTHWCDLPAPPSEPEEKL